MKKIYISFLSLSILVWSCNSASENNSGKDSVTVNISNDTTEVSAKVDSGVE